ncbi:MerR family transcriptional regulator [Paenibacillus senegalensis]|uniref:MerR family transcriptional regulator n=1 Tax=Paenibacillus senegalensis TaxID=1465766 RepID=UPI0002881272|nr:MerR family transcriptional regulator [Paenibacillus senegalensis]
MKQEPTFTIGEFGRKARITVRTLRFYEEIGLLKASKQNESGHRLYGMSELAKLQQIQALKFLGYPLQEIKSLLDDEEDSLTQLEKSLPWQQKLLEEKKEQINRAIEAIERVQRLMKEGQPVTWTVLSSLLFQMEHEEDQKEWIQEYFSEEIAEQFFALSKEQREQMDLEMLEILSNVKELMKRGVSPDTPEAFKVLERLTELSVRNVENKEEFADQLEKMMESEDVDLSGFQFPTLFTSEEEKYLLDIGEAMEAHYQEYEGEED